MSIVYIMIRTVLACLGVSGIAGTLQAAPQKADAALVRHLDAVYQHWRDSVIRRDIEKWQVHTASHRRISILNRIHSERRPISFALSSLPASPPDSRPLKLLAVKVKGITANMIYLGPVDFKVGGTPPNNLLVLSFAKEGNRWKYDSADYMNLASIPEARKQLEAGKLDHLEGPEFSPKGNIEQPAIVLRGAVKYIAKTYVYCPGREVKVMVNGVSRHLYQNTKASEVVIGGARDGLNEVQFTARKLPGGEGKEPLAVRVYLMSQVAGVKPLKVFEYQVQEGEKVNPAGTENFVVGPSEAIRLRGR